MAFSQRGSVLTDTSATISDNFGGGVAISRDGSVLAVGARGYDSPASNAGKVLVYTASGSAWSARATVSCPDVTSGASFGYAVALNSDGTVLAVGVRTLRKVYIFDWNGSSYVQRGSAITGPSFSAFGSGVALSSDGLTLVVGAPTADGSGAPSAARGEVYTYDISGSTYTQRGSALRASDAADQDQFGQSVALSADGAILAVGAAQWENVGSQRGGVYIFDVSGSTWSPRGSVIQAPDAQDSDYFGWGVALSGSGTRLFVGAPLWEGATLTDPGGVYQLDYSGGAW